MSALPLTLPGRVSATCGVAASAELSALPSRHSRHSIAAAHPRAATEGHNNKGHRTMTLPKPRPPLTPGETRAYPVLPLRDIVVFPHMIVPLFVGREKSIRALEEVMRADKQILLATQKNAERRRSGARVRSSTSARSRRVLQLLKLPDGTVKVLVEGVERAQDAQLHRPQRLLRGRRRRARRRRRRRGRGRGAGALGRHRVRELREAQQEDLARGRRRGQPDRGLLQARRHGRLASRHQDSREAGDPGDCRRSSSGWRRCSA